MEVRIYKIEGDAVAKTKALLEAGDMFDVKAKCEACDEVLEGKITSTELSQYLPGEKRGKEVPPKKKCKCGGVFKFETKQLIKNEFARTGYKLRAGEGLELGGGNYLYIKADEDFFGKNESALLEAGAKLLSGEEAEIVKGKIDAEEEAAAAGMGGIFG